MSDRTDRLLALLVILVAIQVMEPTSGPVLSIIGLLAGISAILYAISELVNLS